MAQTADKGQESIDVSIIIPARDEAGNIGHCLDAVYNQQTPYRLEVIVIDSGSADQTAEIAGKYPRVKVVSIPAEAFGHGRTRNMGAELSRGEYLVFLNADAAPVDPNWLNALIAPLREDKTIAGVYSRHLPRPGCRLYMVRDLLDSMPDKAMTRTSAKALDFMIFSTVSCALPRDTWQKFPFDNEIIIAEDQQWGSRVLAQGLHIRYEPASQVYHSHNYSPSQLYEVKRKIAAASEKFKSKFTAGAVGAVLAAGGFTLKVCGDMVFILFKAKRWRKITNTPKLQEIKASFKARAASFAGKFKGWLEGTQP